MKTKAFIFFSLLICNLLPAQNVKLDINMPVTNANDVDLDGFVNSFVSKVQTELENTSPMMGQTGVRVYG